MFSRYGADTRYHYSCFIPTLIILLLYWEMLKRGVQAAYCGAGVGSALASLS